ncbi:unnamed protein product [Closterium sp. Yama58-4]|nr:unnamed protein product [Closterium sp. Yama58-4]
MLQDDEVSRYLSERVRCDVTALEYWRTATNMQTLTPRPEDRRGPPTESVAAPEFAIEGEGAEEEDEEEEEEEEEEEGGEGVGAAADDTGGGEELVVGSSSATALV